MGNAVIKATERYSFGWTDPRGGLAMPTTGGYLRPRSAEEVDTLVENNKMMSAALDNRGKRMASMKTALTYYAMQEGIAGEFAKKVLEDDENG